MDKCFHTRTLSGQASYINVMNSCLYKARVMHHRLAPRPHRFDYKVFLFCLDLEELDTLSARLRWLSHNRFNLFNFRDSDHLQLPAGNPDTAADIRQHLSTYLQSHDIQTNPSIGRIMLLTNCRTLGHQFNPVSFYFIYDQSDRPLCSVVEVGNTFGEMKPYFVGPDALHGSTFRQKTRKYFYVSPFSDMDTWFDFDLSLPEEKLRIKIDDYDAEGHRFFISSLTGRRVPLTDANLLRYFFSIPFITLKVIGLIHWEAFKLWLKKIPFHRKAANADLQKGVYRPYRR